MYSKMNPPINNWINIKNINEYIQLAPILSIISKSWLCGHGFRVTDLKPIDFDIREIDNVLFIFLNELTHILDE